MLQKSKIKSIFGSIFRFISLNSIVLTLLFTLFQLCLIINRFRALKDLSLNGNSFADFLTTANESQNYRNNLTKSVIINTCLLTVSLVLTIFYFLINPIRLGIYSHDNFKLGKCFDKAKSRIVASSGKVKAKPNGSVISTISGGLVPNDVISSASSQSSDDLTRSTTNNSKQPLTKSNSSVELGGSRKTSYCFGLSEYACWSKLPPPGACLHLASALFLLIAELQINSKRIQLGQKPIGDIFATKLDFIFGEPINRLKSFNTYTNSKPVTDYVQSTTSSMETMSSTPLEYLLSDVIYSKDDFSIFNSNKASKNAQSNDAASVAASPSTFLHQLFNSKNTISLNYLNFLIALSVFIVKISQTFWYTSHLYAMLIFVFNSLIASLISISFCSYEILFKANNLKKIAKNFLFFNNINENVDASYATTANDYFTLLSNKINFIGNYGHDIISSCLFLVTTLILIVNSYVFVLYGYRKFDLSKSRIEMYILGYYKKSKIVSSSASKMHDELNLSAQSDESLAVDNLSSSASSSSEINQRFRFLKLYKENLTSSVLFLFYSILRGLFLYETFIVFKYTHDALFIVNIFVELGVLFFWAMFLVLITVKSKWTFKIDSNYKLIYWNWIHYQSKMQTDRSGRLHHELSLTLTKNNTSINTDPDGLTKFLMLNTIEQNNQKSVKSSNTSKRSPNSDKSHTENETSVKSAGDSRSYTNTKLPKSGCLLVRDDSVLSNSNKSKALIGIANRRNSSHLSSSSITEVSSLVPSNLNSYTNNSSSAKKQNETSSSLNLNAMSSSFSSKFTESGIFKPNQPSKFSSRIQIIL